MWTWNCFLSFQLTSNNHIKTWTISWSVFFNQYRLSSSKREKVSQQNLVTVQTIGYSLCSGLRCSKRYDAGAFAKYHIIYSTADTRDIYIEMISEEESSVIYFSNKYISIVIMILKHLYNYFVAIHFTTNSFCKINDDHQLISTELTLQADSQPLTVICVMKI